MEKDFEIKNDKIEKNIEDNNKKNNIEKIEEISIESIASIANENGSEENSKKINENNFIPITKNSSLNPVLFSLSYISEYKCKLCELIPSPETANEVICCGVLYCSECLQKLISTKDEKKECPICKSNDMKYRKIKDENKIFYKVLKNQAAKVLCRTALHSAASGTPSAEGCGWSLLSHTADLAPRSQTACG